MNCNNNNVFSVGSQIHLTQLLADSNVHITLKSKSSNNNNFDYKSYIQRLGDIIAKYGSSSIDSLSEKITVQASEIFLGAAVEMNYTLDKETLTLGKKKIEKLENLIAEHTDSEGNFISVIQPHDYAEAVRVWLKEFPKEDVLQQLKNSQISNTNKESDHQLKIAALKAQGEALKNCLMAMGAQLTELIDDGKSLRGCLKTLR